MSTLDRWAAAARGAARRRSPRGEPRPPEPGRPPWNHNVAYHHVVIDAMPRPCHRALDVGCGQGLLLAELAEHADQVVGIDPDPEVVRSAAARLDGVANVTVVQADVMDADLPLDSFELVTAVAVLHHLPLETGLRRLASLVHPGGTLVVVGLSKGRGPVDLALAAVAFAVSRALVLTRGHTPVDAPLHDPTDTYAEISAAARRLLPGARIRRRLLFRYTLVWQRPT